MPGTQDRINSRAVLGMIYHRLSQPAGLGWAQNISMYVDSDQAIEEYAFLGMVPQMREWLGGRHAHELREDAFQLRNRKYESTLKVMVDNLRRDKTGQLRRRINELAERAESHWMSLLAQLINDAHGVVCYDGQHYFDTDHSTGDSGAQSNRITVDISALPTGETSDSATNPTTRQMQRAILAAAQTMMGFKDDQGEYMNELVRQFQVLAPLNLWIPGAAALGQTVMPGAETNLFGALDGYNFGIAASPRFTATDTFFVFHAGADGSQALIRQEEDGIAVSAKAEGSDFEHDEDAHEYGLKASRAVGVGLWQHGVRVQLV